MSFPPPNSGQYPQYIPPPQYQPGHIPPQQLLYNNVAPPSASPYNGYAKQPVYPHPQGMMPYSTYPQYGQQPQQPTPQTQQQQQPPLMHYQQQLPPQPHPSPIQQLQQQSPHPQFQQQSPRLHVQKQSPQFQYQQQPPAPNIQQQSPRPLLQQQVPRPQQQQQQQQQQQSPRPQFQQQSPRQTIQQQSPRPQFQQPSPREPVHQQSPRPQFHHPSPREPVHQQSPRPQFYHPSPREPVHQQSPRPQFHHPSPRQPVQQQSPRPQFQQQSPRSQPQPQPQSQPQLQPPAPLAPPALAQEHQPRQAPAQPAPPPPLLQEEPQHQFVDPSQLFVQPPLPTAPRSRYSLSSEFVDPSTLSDPPLADLPELPPTTSSAPSQAPSAPSVDSGDNGPPPISRQSVSNTAGQSSFQVQPQSKTESVLQPSPKVGMKPPPTLKAPSTPARSQATPSSMTNAVPQVMTPAASQELKINVQKSQTKPQPKRQSNQQAIQKPSKSTKPPVDYQVLLLSLADEYLNAAHRHGTKMALATSQADIEEYYKLVATGLGCLEAVLKNWRLAPRKEALVRLRYARTLFEETENDLEAETALSKGIDLCEQNRMLDLKYSMQHLLARMLHKTNPKASLKAVDGMIQDVEAYRHAAWEYAFRFLRVSLSLSSLSHQDSVQALQHLHKITAMASRNGDKAVSAMAAVIEALAHLQQGTGSDAIEQAQRAVAAARSHQLNNELRHIPQLATLIQMVDMCCSLLEYDVNQSGQKLKIMQALIDETLQDPNWRPDGSFSIPLNGKSAGPSSIDTGDILQVQNGTLLLSFNWLPLHDLYALSYFLCSITLSAKNSYDGRKAEKYLDEGLSMIQGDFKAPQEISESMANATRRVEWRCSLYCNFLLQRVFLAAARTDWDLASQTLKELRQFTQEIGSDLPHSIKCLMEYAAGTIAQGTGDLAGALSTFQSPLLSLSPSASKTSRNDPCRDTCILAALNTVLIIRDPGHPSHTSLANLLSTLEPFCSSSPNKYIQAAYFLVCATVQTDSTIETKNYLQRALQSATAISNSQITCMTLTFMSWKYFRGVVGEQAEKSARAGRVMANRANDRLWASVTDEMLADTLERQGKGDEARAVREEGKRLIMGLPPGLKRPA